jgi:hypothetical protein
MNFVDEPTLRYPREHALQRMIDERLVLQGVRDSTRFAELGTVHLALGSALDASKRGLQLGDDTWLELRERMSLQALTLVGAERASRIRFLSHQWSNQLHALSELIHDEDLALLAEDFYMDSRIMLATDHSEASAGSHDPVAVGDDALLGRLMYQCYQLGGWPCGWHGHFPLGQLQIFARLAVS